MLSPSPALGAALASDATTLCTCWRLTRSDGRVLGFTEHDRDVTAFGTLFAAAAGATPAALDQAAGLAADTTSFQGALSSDALAEPDILAGRYDGATVEIFLVDWSSGEGLLTAAGQLGELRREGLLFTAELLSPADRLNRPVGGTFERTCRARLGDADCGVDLSRPSYRSLLTIARPGTGRLLHVAGIEAFAGDWFSAGTLAFRSGANAGQTLEIRAHRREAGSDLFDLWEAPAFPVVAGDSATATAGCRRSFAACRGKFDNHLNFRGFPHVPGSDAVTRYGVEGALGQSGGSLLGAV